MTRTHCPDCHDQQRIATPDGWVACSCHWRNRILRDIPAALHEGSPYLPPDVLAMPPWSLTEDRFEQGSWTEFRQHAMWSLAAHLSAHEQPASVVVLSTKRLRDIEFGEDSEYVGAGVLLWGPKAPDVLILLGQLSNPMHEKLTQELLTTWIRNRKVHHKTVWGFQLAESFARLEAFPGDRATARPLVLSGSTQAALPEGTAPQAAKPHTKVAIIARGGKLVY